MLVKSAGPSATMFERCARATLVTSTVCDPDEALVEAVAVKAVVWLLPTEKLLKSVKSFNVCADA